MVNFLRPAMLDIDRRIPSRQSSRSASMYDGRIPYHVSLPCLEFAAF